jgi:cell division FtsZ-interacting protein ZapD
MCPYAFCGVLDAPRSSHTERQELQLSRGCCYVDSPDLHTTKHTQEPVPESTYSS